MAPVSVRLPGSSRPLMVENVAWDGYSRSDSFPRLIQDEAKASDKLLRVGVRNGEGYVTEYLLVKYGLSKPWTATELEAGRDQEVNEDFAEQIPVTAHMVYEGDDVAAVVRVPSAVRVSTAVTTALTAPSPATKRPAEARASEKGPERIRLKKKATQKVVPAGVRASLAEGTDDLLGGTPPPGLTVSDQAGGILEIITSSWDERDPLRWGH
ncbi:hypothetical protein Taro_030343, partial [Colocasia esculenta]|nr:hypothetical protein [Colocasia esculenta]